MYRMSSFMYHCSHVIQLPRGIHKYKWCTTFSERAIISSGRFAFPAIQIKMTKASHLFQAISKKRVKFFKTINGFFNQLFTCFKRIKLLFVFSRCFKIPGMKIINTQFLLFSHINIMHKWKHMKFYRFMKLETIFFCIIKASHLCKLVITVIVKTGIYSYAMTFFQEA